MQGSDVLQQHHYGLFKSYQKHSDLHLFNHCNWLKIGLKHYNYHFLSYREMNARSYIDKR